MITKVSESKKFFKGFLQLTSSYISHKKKATPKEFCHVPFDIF